MGNLSKNFSRYEFTCNCGCGHDQVDMKLITGLQKLRDKLGKTIINSGCRCTQYNRNVGGSPRSQHQVCRAADVRVEGKTSNEVAQAAEEIKEFKRGGIGIYPNFVHLDVRGYKARWDLRK